MRGSFYILTLLTVLFLSCSPKEQSFDKEKWTVKVFDAFHYRDAMLKDLMENHLKEGDKYQHVIDILGDPDNTEVQKGEFTFWYEIKKIADNNEPRKMKTLFITFSADSLLRNYRVEEWKFK